MKTLKTLCLIILISAIAICGYLCYQEYTKDVQTVEDSYEPAIVMLNDSTYHVNLSDSMCCTLMKCGNILSIETVGAEFVMASHSHDSINIGLVRTYVLNYTDFFGQVQFDSIDLKCK